MTKIVFVPTSHVASQSVRNVKEAIEKEKPDCVAVELDVNRLMSFKQKQGSNRDAIKNIGVTTFLIYWIMKKLQDWLGKKTGILPGSEMVMAINAAHEKGIKVALIDQDINITFIKMQKMPLSEKLKLIWFLIKGMTIGLVASKIGKGETVDLSKLPPKDLINQAMLVLKNDFPHLYKILVTDRNKVMVKNIKHLQTKFK
ncbi:MAG: TraB/GumN family protein, partial [Candidatus Aenigmatarchaeota archaeon]